MGRTRSEGRTNISQHARFVHLRRSVNGFPDVLLHARGGEASNGGLSTLADGLYSCAPPSYTTFWKQWKVVGITIRQ